MTPKTNAEKAEYIDWLIQHICFIYGMIGAFLLAMLFRGVGWI